MCTQPKSRNLILRTELIQMEAYRLFKVFRVIFYWTTSPYAQQPQIYYRLCRLLLKCVELQAVSHQSAQTAAEAFISVIITRYGDPYQNQSDHGSAAESAFLNNLSSFLVTDKTMTSTYHRLGNGLVEG
ncbi:hypothetical protein RF11_00235 [Thelohanellus kitauei]|uniref:Uncharacterized protein n=1 Tax=Thelohanellus kitauei TaxID=669202 RepID=A0A0C2NEH2_THEKT|nr:hypothetical protein RF11_00235 [Thelohanellus kitauei]